MRTITELRSDESDLEGSGQTITNDGHSLGVTEHEQHTHRDMVVQALRILRRATRAFSNGSSGPSTSGNAGKRAGSGGSCAGPTPTPPCPACEPRAPPACRSRQPGSQSALRVVCCPPRRRAEPPCVPTRSGLTCEHVTPQNWDETLHRERQTLTGGQDRVAQRLQAAKRTRQLDYEREVAMRGEAGAASSPPPARYLMGAERELVRATDGRLYALPRGSAGRPRCAADGSAPPPRALTLEESNPTCHPGDRGHVDPCAHRPKVFLEIDRSASAASSAPTQPSPSVPSPCSGNSGTKVCSRKTREAGRRAGDIGWCSKPASPPNPSQRCRPLSIIERLQGRTSRSTPRNRKPWGERRLHTSVVSAATSVQEIRRQKQTLKEAGRGREAGVSGGTRPAPPVPPSPAGQLALRVAPGTRAVRVHVFLERAPGGPPAHSACDPVPAAKPCGCLTTMCKSSVSWLSLKNIHNKIGSSPVLNISGSDLECRSETRSVSESNRLYPVPPVVSSAPTTGVASSPGSNRQKVTRAIPLTKFVLDKQL